MACLLVELARGTGDNYLIAYRACNGVSCMTADGRSFSRTMDLAGAWARGAVLVPSLVLGDARP